MTVKLLHQIGDRAMGTNFNTLEEILACNEPMHFDGIYESVWTHHEALIGKGKDFTFFVSGAYLGRTNAFDIGQPLSKFCTFEQVETMAERLNAQIGWHGMRHRRCCDGMTAIDIQQEIEVPQWWATSSCTIPVLAWPYGNFNREAMVIAERLGFREAWAVNEGDGSQFQKRREHLNW